jgi:hypothetical protein
MAIILGLLEVCQNVTGIRALEGEKRILDRACLEADSKQSDLSVCRKTGFFAYTE